MQQIISQTYKEFFNNDLLKVEALAKSGSDRQYFRCFTKNETIIAVYNKDIVENELFLSFTEVMLRNNIPSPQILACTKNKEIYFLNDLGNENLLDKLVKERTSKSPFPFATKKHFKQALKDLVKIQLSLHKEVDYNKCKPYQRFDASVIQRDLNYFKDWYLKPAAYSFNEDALDKDFQFIEEYLLEENEMYFMFRDFQSRNIMIHKGTNYYIDYQGAMNGPLQYDVVSLLFQAKAAIPEYEREDLLEYYLSELQKEITVAKETFLSKYYAFVLIRILQTLGAYGRRGWHEQKTHFLESIPLAIENLKRTKKKMEILHELPEINNIIDQIIQNPKC